MDFMTKRKPRILVYLMDQLNPIFVSEAEYPLYYEDIYATVADIAREGFWANQVLYPWHMITRIQIHE